MISLIALLVNIQMWFTDGGNTAVNFCQPQEKWKTQWDVQSHVVWIKNNIAKSVNYNTGGD